MSSEAAHETFGDQIVARRHLTIASYGGYVIMPHFAEFPEEAARAYREADYSSQAVLSMRNEFARIKKDIKEGMNTGKFQAMVLGQLVHTLSSALRDTGFPRNLSRAKETHYVHDMRGYLVEIIGPLTMKELAEEGFMDRNPRLADLKNPFDNPDVLEMTWRLQADRRLTRGLGSKVALPQLLPGYYD